MGGFGSGRWTRHNSPVTIEATKRIDIRYMRRHGMLKHHAEGFLSWSRGGERCGDIRYKCYPDYLLLKYRYRRRDDDWQAIEQKIWFDRTPCRYGGERLWFLCTGCGKRVGILCSDGPLFLCRHCYQLPYQSQNQSTLDRIISQRHKLGERIFEHYQLGKGWGKKKGMHQRTFDRLYARFKRLDQLWTYQMVQYLPDYDRRLL